MRKSTLWLSIASVIIIVIAILLISNIAYPSWVQSLLFWRPQGQREIAWFYGVDLGETYRMSLVPKEEEEPSAAQMQAALAVVEIRAESLAMTDPVVQLADGNTIAVQMPRSQALSTITSTLQAPGLVEFINAGTEYPASPVVETTLSEPQPTPAPTEGITGTQAITPTVYETLMTNNDLEHIELRPPRYGYYSVKFKLKPSGTEALLAQNQNHPGAYVCITLDKRILTCALSTQLMNTDVGGNVEYPIIIEEQNAESVSALLRSGMLPVPLQVGEAEDAGPTLGEEAIRRLATAAFIGLGAALAFLLVHYRLPGLLAVLPLLVLALISLALCRILPLPVTLATITGLGAMGLTTLGALLSVVERLRSRMQAGQVLTRAIEGSLSDAWPLIRDTHLALGLLAVATWIVGTAIAAQTLHWLGASLVAGALASLFSTIVFGYALIRLIFAIEPIQKLLNERGWLLGT
jgi:protein-export membrane protein SecD